MIHLSKKRGFGDYTSSLIAGRVSQVRMPIWVNVVVDQYRDSKAHVLVKPYSWIYQTQ